MPGVYKETDEDKPVDFLLFGGYSYLVCVTGIQRDTSFKKFDRVKPSHDDFRIPYDVAKKL